LVGFWIEPAGWSEIGEEGEAGQVCFCSAGAVAVVDEEEGEKEGYE
jgi:hypothetical protein